MKRKGTTEMPTVFVIFGVTGDLSRTKLIPAIFNLYKKGHLPRRFRIIGSSRRDESNESFREYVRTIVHNERSGTQKNLKAFLDCVTFHRAFFDDSESYARLGEELVGIDGHFGKCSNKLFYLAVPPNLYEVMFKELANSGLTIPCSDEEGWTRVLVEKPFGKDIDTARELDKMLGLLFKEEQIFRIDHYLAKETMQNILMFRFSNAIFEPIWNRNYIDKVEIMLLEKAGVGGRGAFYDEVGALRDVGQNHILQMLALIAMDDPKKLSAEHIRGERARVLKALHPIKGKNVGKVVVRGQYRGYLQEKGIKKKSSTETYFSLEARIHNARWKGVPFYLKSGKALKGQKTEITVYFKKTASCLCPAGAEIHRRNALTFRIQPDEGISIRFWAKTPGFTQKLEAKNLSFLYHAVAATKEAPEAYERVLFDCIRGDQTLFMSTREVRSSWAFITPILRDWGKTLLYTYKKGSGGPKALPHF